MHLRITNSRPEQTMFSALVSNPRLRLSSLKTTQGPLRHRLAILASQSSSMHVLICKSSMCGRRDERSFPPLLYRLRGHPLGLQQARFLCAGQRLSASGIRLFGTYAASHRTLGAGAAQAVWPPCRVSRTGQRDRWSLRCNVTTFWCCSRSIRQRLPCIAKPSCPVAPRMTRAMRKWRWTSCCATLKSSSPSPCKARRCAPPPDHARGTTP